MIGFRVAIASSVIFAAGFVAGQWHGDGSAQAQGRKVFEQFSMACQQYLGFRPRFAGAICRDARVPDAIRAQTALPVRHPQSQAYEDVLRIVEAINTG